MLPLVLPLADVAALAAEAGSGSAVPGVTVDLETCRLVSAAGRSTAFPISAYRRQGLLTGLDDIALTRTRQPALDAFLAAGQAASPWLYPRIR